MQYVADTLEIERGNVTRAVRAFESTPVQDGEAGARELILRNRKRVLDEALSTLEEGEAMERELDPVLDLEYVLEVLRSERARLLEVNRSLAATVEASGVRYPWGRIELNLERVAELDEWTPVLGERLDRRSRIGFA